MPSGVTTEPLSPGFSSFTATDPPEPFDTFGELEVWILKANAATSDAKSSSSSDGSKRQRVDGGYDINTDSVVVLLGFPLSKAWFVVTGDATATTMYQVNEVVNDSVKKKYLQHVVMMTVPHHGSTSTSFDVRGGGEATLKTFAEKIEPVSVIGSADKVGTYKQPSARVLQYFWPYVTVGEPFWGIRPSAAGTSTRRTSPRTTTSTTTTRGPSTPGRPARTGTRYRPRPTSTPTCTSTG